MIAWNRDKLFLNVGSWCIAIVGNTSSAIYCFWKLFCLKSCTSAVVMFQSFICWLASCFTLQQLAWLNLVSMKWHSPPGLLCSCLVTACKQFADARMLINVGSCWVLPFQGEVVKHNSSFWHMKTPLIFITKLCFMMRICSVGMKPL